MIELLILYTLNKSVSTMYGISKSIRSSLSALTTPSIGTIKPALDRLVTAGFIKFQKTMSKGGRPSNFYSITDLGRSELKKILLAPVQDNPIQFLATARVKLYCADILDSDETLELIKTLKSQTNILYSKAKQSAEKAEGDFYSELVLDNLGCEYKNFISLLEGVERACKN